MSANPMTLPPPPANPEDALNSVIVPVDIPTPFGTIRAGTSLTVVVARMNALYALLVQYHPQVPASEDAVEGYKVFFGDGSSRVYPTDYPLEHVAAMGMAVLPLYIREGKEAE